MSELVRGRARVVLGILITTVVGCDLLGRELNPAFCAAHPEEVGCRQVIPDAAPDSPPDGPMLCTANSECQSSVGTPVCDLGDTKMCVQCTQSDNPCPMAMPACVDKQCKPCTRHDQCAASNVCLPGGTCADETKVAYVAPTGSSGECTKLAPCRTLAEGVNKNRLFVKIATGTIADATTTTIDGKAVTIFADPGARLDRTTEGTILEVRNNGADVQIFDLEIAGATTSTGEAAILIPMNGAPKLTLTRVTIDGNQGLGISVSAGTLTMSRCTVQQNDGGGVQVGGGMFSVFDISDSIIVHNGRATDPASDVGGASLRPNTASKFERNTVAFNESSGLNNRGGVSCNAPMAVASGNLVFHNTESMGTGTKTDAMTQRDGACQFGNTLVIATDDPGNLGFAKPTVAPYNFHLTGNSPLTVRDAAGACTGFDFDGDTRPINGACDFGADEYHP